MPIRIRSFARADDLALHRSRREKLLAAVDDVAASDMGSREERRERQWRRLREILGDAYRNVPLYRNKYREAGFDPESLRGLGDLRRIPLLTKSDLRNAGTAMLKHESRREPAWLLSSSGSSGKPSRVFREEQALWRFLARSLTIFRAWCGGKPLGNVLSITDLAAGSVDFALADLSRTLSMQTRIVASNRSTEEHVDAIDYFRPEFLSSYPSTLHNIAMAARRRNKTFPTPKLVHLTSETLDPTTRALVSGAFPAARLVETYTSSEAGLIAYSCPQKPTLLHLAESEVLLETTDAEGNPTAGSGQIVVTDLVNRSTPIVRYAGLGDLATVEPGPCACGAACGFIRRLEGRLSESICTPEGHWISPYVLIDAIEEVGGIYRFQIVQDREGEIAVRVVRDESARSGPDETRTAIRRALTSAVPSIAVDVVFVPAIAPETDRHKIPLVVSRIRKTPATPRPEEQGRIATESISSRSVPQ